MSKTMPQESFYQELFDILEETFETHHGVYLDKGTSLFTTLDQISAAEASLPVGNRCATIAAQVEHVIYYLEVLGRHIAGEEVGEVDWGEIWSRVSEVTPAEWDGLRDRLKEAYARLIVMLRGIEDWEQNDAVGGSIAILVHTAYHLGEIRQALCTVGQFREEEILTLMNPLTEQLSNLTQAHTDFVQTANQLDPQKRDQPAVCGEWSPKDVVSHLVGWDQALLEFISDTDNFSPPHDIDQFNQQSVQLRKHLGWSEVMQEMEVNFRNLQQAVVAVHPEMKIYERVTSWLAGRAEDYTLHQIQLAAWL